MTKPGSRTAQRDEARARLKSSVDALADRTNMQLQMQKEPLKMLGGATGVGLALGMLVGRQFRRTRRIYVDAASPEKEQKALMKAQKKSGGNSIGGALLATAATLGFKILQERVLVPRLEEFADRLMTQQGAAADGKTGPVKPKIVLHNSPEDFLKKND
ncbi:hypothetical protein MF271_07630 [Deinococcus sp. KNUC1210]|uniref:hypothetical protein n=1 Tax=Deinococcus sp. KNUC1210 TaxID=2917691 RepID=UPI001EF02FF0|nr:hypothetical protein [Deinococcus sp. KNUC1210]ULH16442.1 hypothetical protein MF271_07630 [Deinococcus sp. KNUC1210]